MSKPTVQTGVGGRYKLDAVCAVTGKRRSLADWFPNLITDAGLDRVCTMVSNEAFRYCHVGTGSTPPTALDTQLAQKLAHTSDHPVGGANRVAAPDYYLWMQRVYRFAPPAAAGNISEVGVGWGTSSGLFSRALVLDGNGAPTSVTVLSSEYLEVTYEFRLYPMVDDQTGVVTLDGVDYAYTIRPCNIDGYSTLTTFTYTSGRTVISDTDNLARIFQAGGTRIAQDGPIGIATETPPVSAESTTTFGSISVASAGAGTHTVVYATFFDLQHANFAAGIGSFTLPAGYVAYQIGFVPNIPKTAAHQLTLNLEVTYSNRPAV